MKRALVCMGLAALLNVAAACGSVAGNDDDAAVGDDGGPTIDAGMQPDGGGDAGTVPSAPPSTELTSGGAKISGSTYSLDVQVGHALSQGKATGGGKTVEGGAAIKP